MTATLDPQPTKRIHPISIQKVPSSEVEVLLGPFATDQPVAMLKFRFYLIRNHLLKHLGTKFWKLERSLYFIKATLLHKFEDIF